MSSNPLSFKIKVETIDGKNFIRDFPQEIKNVKNDIREIYFEKIDQSEINSRYANATVKADISMFNDNSVRTWLEGNKLYVASPDTIYLYDGFSFSVLASNNNSPIEKIVFNNVNTSEMTSMVRLFFGMSSITELDLSSFDTRKVSSIDHMFYNCSSLTELDLSSFDTSNVTLMTGTFSYCSNLTEIDLTSFNTSNVIGMSSLFYGCSSLIELDLSNFDTSNVKAMCWTFNGCTNLEKVYVSNIWTTSAIVEKAVGYSTNSSSVDMFGTSSISTQTKKIVGGSGTTFNSSKRNKEYARIDDPANGKPGYFTYKAYSGA